MDTENPSRRNDLVDILKASIEETGKQITQKMDEEILERIIGSKILDFRIEPIPNESGFYSLHIKTDAPPLTYKNELILNGKPIPYGKVTIDISTINLKVKL